MKLVKIQRIILWQTENLQVVTTLIFWTGYGGKQGMLISLNLEWHGNNSSKTYNFRIKVWNVQMVYWFFWSREIKLSIQNSLATKIGHIILKFSTKSKTCCYPLKNRIRIDFYFILSVKFNLNSFEEVENTKWQF